MQKYLLTFPQENGDTPVMGKVVAPDLKTALIELINVHGLSAKGGTITDGEYKPIGVLRIDWPGPVISCSDIIFARPFMSWGKLNSCDYDEPYHSNFIAKRGF